MNQRLMFIRWNPRGNRAHLHGNTNNTQHIIKPFANHSGKKLFFQHKWEIPVRCQIDKKFITSHLWSTQNPSPLSPHFPAVGKLAINLTFVKSVGCPGGVAVAAINNLPTLCTAERLRCCLRGGPRPKLNGAQSQRR